MDEHHHYFKKYSKSDLSGKLIAEPLSGDLTENPNKIMPLEEPPPLSPLAIHRSISAEQRESRVLSFLFGQSERLKRLYE